MKYLPDLKCKWNIRMCELKHFRKLNLVTFMRFDSNSWHLLTALIKMSPPLTSFIQDSTRNISIFAQREKTDYTKHEYADIKDKYLINSHDQKNSCPQRKQTAGRLWLNHLNGVNHTWKNQGFVPRQWWLMVPWWRLKQTGLIERAYLYKRWEAMELLTGCDGLRPPSWAGK